jgi:hypothetical protein
MLGMLNVRAFLNSLELPCPENGPSNVTLSREVSTLHEIIVFTNTATLRRK